MSFGKDPMIERKGNNSDNAPGVEACVLRQREREKNLHPLRVSPTTVIYVTKYKCTPEHAEKYRREKLGIK